jgi:hypothetical protein
VEVLEVGPVLKFHASGTQQPVPACHESTPRMQLAVANLTLGTHSALPQGDKTLPELGSLLPRTSENSSSTHFGE